MLNQIFKKEHLDKMFMKVMFPMLNQHINYYITDLVCYNQHINYYITDLVCYTHFHWFFNHECQYIFGKQTGYIFQSPKNCNMDDKKITLHWIKSIIWNSKCIFPKLNAVFILKTAVWTKKILQQIIPSQIPDQFSKLLSSMAVP